ncbi:Uncharacterized protein APZ42_026746 [Daphnia magna]|uniref:Uncharacterized protein n=1 Tax=Daphnia magna TaxID=35525 RepID=A0A164RWA0_9CRUS|nr:Uncharacterized protein APZ42_026746 [Daphnia magna]
MSSSGGGTHHPIPEFRDADHFWGPGLSQVVNGSHEIIRPKPRSERNQTKMGFCVFL